jgi:hypothetical protein
MKAALKWNAHFTSNLKIHLSLQGLLLGDDLSPKPGQGRLTLLDQ